MHFALVGVTVLVPAQDDLLGQNFGLVEQQNYLLERLHKVHVLVAELLHLQDQSQLRPVCRGESLQQGAVRLQVTNSLVGNQLLLLVPFAQ